MCRVAVFIGMGVVFWAPLHHPSTVILGLDPRIQAQAAPVLIAPTLRTHQSRPAQSPAVVVKDHSGEAHAYAEPLWNMKTWLRICVAFGVLSGLPVPTGDLLASLHIGLR